MGLRSSATGGSYGANEARRLGLVASDVASVATATIPSVAMSRFGGVPLVPLLFFYDKTHICLTEHYRTFVLSYRNSGAAIKPGMFIGEAAIIIYQKLTSRYNSKIVVKMIIVYTECVEPFV